MIKSDLAKWRALHVNECISKAHLARMIGVSRSYITKLENGSLQPSAEMMFRICEYLGRRVEEVFRYVPDGKERS